MTVRLGPRAERDYVTLAVATARTVVLRPLRCTATAELFRVDPTVSEALGAG